MLKELKAALDKVLDEFEDKAKASPEKIDDIVVLTVCRVIRSALKIADND